MFPEIERDEILELFPTLMPTSGPDGKLTQHLFGEVNLTVKDAEKLLPYVSRDDHDGQHRIFGLVLAGETDPKLVIPMNIWVGLTKGAGKTLDQGKGRNLGDRLDMDGEANATSLAGALNVLNGFIESPSHHLTKSGGYNHPTIPYAVDHLLLDHPQVREIVDNTKDDWSSKRPYQMVSPAIGRAFHYIVTSIDPVKGEEFMQGFYTGTNLKTGDPVHTLREQLVSWSGKKAHLRPTTKEWCAWMVKAWNASVKGESPKIFVYRQTEKFPAFEGIEKTGWFE